MEFTCIQKETFTCQNDQMRGVFRTLYLNPKVNNSYITSCQKKLQHNKTEYCNICAIIHTLKWQYKKYDVKLKDVDDTCAIMVKTPCLDQESEDCHPHQVKAYKSNETDVFGSSTVVTAAVSSDNKMDILEKSNVGKDDAVQKANMSDNKITPVNKKAHGTIDPLNENNGNNIVIIEENNSDKSNDENGEELVETLVVDNVMMEMGNSDSKEGVTVEGIVDNDSINQNMSEQQTPSHEYIIQQDKDEVVPKKERCVLTLSELFKSHCISSCETSDSFRNTLLRILHFWFGNVFSSSLKSILRLIRSNTHREQFCGVYEWVLYDNVLDSIIVVIPICRLDDWKLLLHQSYGFIYNKADSSLSAYIHQKFDANISNLLSIPTLTWLNKTFSDIKGRTEKNSKPGNNSNNNSEKSNRKRKHRNTNEKEPKHWKGDSSLPTA